MTRKLAIIATHPIQYHAPWFRALSASPRLDVRVFFAALPSAQSQGVGFGRRFEWDVPLLDGYRWELLENRTAAPRLGRFLGSSTPAVGERLRSYGPDAVLLTGWNQLPLLQALRAAAQLALPTLVRGESSGLKPRRAAVRLVHRRLLRRYDVFLAIGSANRDFYLANSVSPQRIVDCPYFVDNERFHAQAVALGADRPDLRRAWGVAENRFCVAFVGKLVPKKRPLDLVDAVAAAGAQGAALHLLVVGSGELETAVRERCAAMGVATTFAGFLNQSQIAKAYVACDCLALPSDYDETWGLVVNEAMVCGRPAIVSDRVGCGPDLVHNGETGHRFQFGDVSELADRLAELSRDGEAARRMGATARQLVLGSFSVERARDAVQQALEIALTQSALAKRAV